MSKLELSINVQYLPSWGAWEGIRELVQNGKDAETEFEAPLKVTHLNGTLRIENEGAVLSREALLFGTSSKAGRSDMIGKFGEGLKLGILALVRAGHKVRIRTGSEVWTAFIAKSERYGADVLWFDCVGGREDKRRVRVEIDNVSGTEWERLRERFLFLGKRGKDDRVDTDRGELLLGEKFREGCTLDLIDIVEFRAENLRGQYKDGRILLASKVVADRDQCLATLIHEFSHRIGSDGEKGHVAEIEATWRDLVKHLRGGTAS